uniref:DUF4283 domain-containing protein n=1 Tax=Quercus lobata TaxID=97700 RepID=A0A7N2M3V1_QUELO
MEVEYTQENQRSRDTPGAYAQAFKFDNEITEHEDSDTEVEDLVEGMTEVVLSKETKARIRAPWSKALIVKVYGRTVGFSYLTFKLNALWKPMAKMDCVNLGKDFFLIKFSDPSYYDKVLKGGPWFFGEHFLAIKPWEPYIKASEATFSSVAVWVRLPELPIEFYDLEVLRKIGGAIGPVLRELIPIRPLALAMLDFVSKLGHKQEFCCYKIRPREAETGELDTASLNHKSNQEEDKSDANYGAWMLFTRKQNPARIGQGRGPNLNGGKIEKGK